MPLSNEPYKLIKVGDRSEKRFFLSVKQKFFNEGAGIVTHFGPNQEHGKSIGEFEEKRKIYPTLKKAVK